MIIGLRLIKLGSEVYSTIPNGSGRIYYFEIKI